MLIFSEKMKKIKFMLEENEHSWKDFRNYVNSFNWDKVTFFLCLYIGGVIGFYYFITLKLKFYTYLWGK